MAREQRPSTISYLLDSRSIYTNIQVKPLPQPIAMISRSRRMGRHARTSFIIVRQLFRALGVTNDHFANVKKAIENSKPSRREDYALVDENDEWIWSGEGWGWRMFCICGRGMTWADHERQYASPEDAARCPIYKACTAAGDGEEAYCDDILVAGKTTLSNYWYEHPYPKQLDIGTFSISSEIYTEVAVLFEMGYRDVKEITMKVERKLRIRISPRLVNDVIRIEERHAGRDEQESSPLADLEDQS